MNYLLVNTSTTPETCDNVVVWDGDTNTWTPPASHIALLQETTPSKDWSWDATSNTWVLAESIGDGQIGYTWDGVALTTNEPQPVVPQEQTTQTGAEEF